MTLRLRLIVLLADPLYQKTFLAPHDMSGNRFAILKFLLKQTIIYLIGGMTYSFKTVQNI
jgi:hypothetical protein